MPTNPLIYEHRRIIKPDYYYEISVTDVEGYTPTFIGYYAWDEDEDGPIPGIKLFKDFNIYLEREYCEY